MGRFCGERLDAKMTQNSTLSFLREVKYFHDCSFVERD